MKLVLTVTKAQKKRACRAAKVLCIKKLRLRGCSSKDIKASVGRLTMFVEIAIDKAPFAVILK